MWRQQTLNRKLLVLLITVQAIILSLGVFGLLQWDNSNRLDELGHRLDSQTDELEDMITIDNGHWTVQHHSERSKELAKDTQFYFEVRDAGNNRVVQAQTSAQEVSQALALSAPVLFEDSEFARLDTSTQPWLLQRTEIKRAYDGLVVTATLYTAMNIANAFGEIIFLQKLAASVIFVVLLLSALSSYVIVTYTTRNLRAFAQHIRTLKPPDFSGQTHLVPQSAEEQLLFDSYATMVNSIKKTMENQQLFIANAAHELKTPIAASLSALEVLLVRPRSTEDYQATCADVLAELQVLRRLSESLLNLARLDKTSADNASCSLHAVLEQVHSRWQKAAQQKNIQIHIDTPKSVQLKGDASTWETILGNLADNAIKYGHSEGNLWISGGNIACGEAEGENLDNGQDETPRNYFLDIEVRDDGSGMSKDDIQQLGTLFFRADPARSGADSFGLGFAQVKRLLENLGGDIQVNQVQSGGLSIHINAPLKQ